MVRKKQTRVGFIITTLLLCSFFSGKIDNDNRIEKIDYALAYYTETYPQQKVYLHFDKPSYAYGDIIFFKAYLVSALNHTPDKLSTNLYVELINPEKTIVETKRFWVKDGVAKGDFMIRDTMPEGLYQVRAYTNWMRNFAPEFYFTRNIQITNPLYKTHISPSDSKRNRRILRRNKSRLKDIDFQFLPEGGNLVYGLTSTVGFKAVNNAGKGVDVKGTVYNSGKNRIADFSSLTMGMGRFSFKPVKGEKYFAVIESNDKSFRLDLPKPMETGIIMGVNNLSDGYIHVKLLSKKFKTEDRFANEVILIGQTRGQIYFSKVVDLSGDSAEIDIDKYLFPTGITQLTVFSGRLIPVAERLVFINHHDFLSFKCKKPEKISKDSLLLKITSVNQNGSAVPADLSLAVLNYDNPEDDPFNTNIVQYLNLISDLKGYVEDPSFYFSNSDPLADKALDNLMITQGWRRFDWNEVIAGRYQEMKYNVEKKITIEGKITREFFELPLPDCEVRLSVLNRYNDVFYTRSARDGSFKFDNLVYNDTVDVRIEANRPTGRKNLVIVLPETTQEPVYNFYGNFFLTTESARNNKAYRTKMHQETLKKMKEEEIREANRNKITGIYSKADNVIRSEDIPEGYNNVLQVLQGRVPGVDVQGQRVIIRGVKTFYGSTDPLYIIDGVPVDGVQSILNIPVQDVDRIEILKGPSTAIYGSRGANGVIAVYTKRGEFMVKGRIDFQMLGYATPRKFYMPKFDYKEDTMNKLMTLNWVPDIKTDENGQISIKQKLPENIEKITLVIEGLTADGKPGASKIVFDLD